jgi:hypothetical protein
LNLPSMIGGSTRSRNGGQVCPPLQHPSPWHVRSRSQRNDSPNQIGQAAFSASQAYTLIVAISPYGKGPASVIPLTHPTWTPALFVILCVHTPNFGEPSKVIGHGPPAPVFETGEEELCRSISPKSSSPPRSWGSRSDLLFCNRPRMRSGHRLSAILLPPAAGYLSPR